MALMAMLLMLCLLLAGFAVLVMFVGDVYVSGGLAGGIVLLVLIGAASLHSVRRVPGPPASSPSHAHNLEMPKAVPTVSGQVVSKESPHADTDLIASSQPVFEKDAGLSAQSGLYATQELAFEDAVEKLADKISQQINGNGELPAPPAEIKAVLRQSRGDIQQHHTAQPHDLGDGLVATMHHVEAWIPWAKVEEVRQAMSRWLAVSRSVQLLSGLAIGAVVLLVSGGMFSLLGGRRGKKVVG